MTELPLAAAIAVGLAAGSAIGAAFCTTLYWNGCLFARGRWLAALAMQLLRFALVALLLVALAHAGAITLIASCAGMFIARTWWVRRLLRTLV